MQWDAWKSGNYRSGFRKKYPAGLPDTLIFFWWFRDQAPHINIIVWGLVFDPLSDRLGGQLPAPDTGPSRQRLKRVGFTMVGVGPLIGSATDPSVIVGFLIGHAVYIIESLQAPQNLSLKRKYIRIPCDQPLRVG